MDDEKTQIIIYVLFGLLPISVNSWSANCQPEAVVFDIRAPFEKLLDIRAPFTVERFSLVGNGRIAASRFCVIHTEKNAATSSSSSFATSSASAIAASISELRVPRVRNLQQQGNVKLATKYKAESKKDLKNKAKAQIDHISIHFAREATHNWTAYQPRMFKSTDKVAGVERWIKRLTGAKNIMLKALISDTSKETASIDMKTTVADIARCDGFDGDRWIVYSQVPSKVSADQKAASEKPLIDRLAKGKGAATHGTSTQSSPPSTARRKSDAAGRVAAANKAAKKSGKAAPASAAAAAASAS